jgi:hypothetical protein
MGLFSCVDILGFGSFGCYDARRFEEFGQFAKLLARGKGCVPRGEKAWFVVLAVV